MFLHDHKAVMTPQARNAQRGLTLVELMIALAMGLLLMLGVMNVYLGNRQAYRVTESVNRIQDSARVAAELMTREIREAGGTLCGSHVVESHESVAWLDWEAGGLQAAAGDTVLGGVAFGSEAAERAEGTQAILLQSASLGGGVPIRAHAADTGIFTVPEGHGFAVNDVLVACDMRKASILTLTGSAATTLTYNKDLSALNFDPDGFKNPGAVLNRAQVTLWFVGANSRGGLSLYRRANGGGAQEIAEGVQDIRFQFLTRNGSTVASDYVAVDGISSWKNDAPNLVTAVRIEMTVRAEGNVGTGGDPVERDFFHIVNLRHRENVQ